MGCGGPRDQVGVIRISLVLKGGDGRETPPVSNLPWFPLLEDVGGELQLQQESLGPHTLASTHMLQPGKAEMNMRPSPEMC